ncbi:MAG: septum formation initiator family protein [Bryobacterales bacterium]|nr:septum formation initiator family protein [Bryobacterales bacterium]MDE0264895.1 septum formation initiator family protein [Bryobacterales bacterium]MDE0621769.1 septum formation initiator family protein [Bryobacterales bacterium]
MSDDPTRRRRPRDADEEKPSRLHFSPRAIWLVGVPFVMLPLFVGLYMLGQNPVEPLIEALDNEDRLKRQIEDLKQENSELQQDIDALGPGQFGIEKRARERLGWSKPGEVVIHVPDKR